jgi:hypothetical protein
MMAMWVGRKLCEEEGSVLIPQVIELQILDRPVSGLSTIPTELTRLL